MSVLAHIRRKVFYQCYRSRSICNNEGFELSNMKNRKIIKPTDLSENDIKTILLTALEMKEKKSDDLLTGYHATYFYARRVMRNQISFQRAMNNLGGQISLLYDNPLFDLPWFDYSSHYKTKVMAAESKVPVFNTRCDLYANARPLGDLLTLLEVFGDLQGKKVAWIGPASPVVESCLYFLPKMGMDLKLYCFCPKGSGRMAPKNLSKALASSHGDHVVECSSLEEAITGVDVLISSSHDVPSETITTKLLQKANTQWYFLHCLPRSSFEVTDEVFYHRNNLTCKSANNTIYVFMAIAALLLTDYKTQVRLESICKITS